MAKSIQTMGDELCCSLCVDIFRKPVSLPCHHSFCRECVRFLVEKSKPIEGEDKPNSPGSNSIPHHVTCPLCRAPTVLTQEDVTALPVNRELGEKVAKIQPDVKAKEDTPLCSMCKDAAISAATIFCSNCDGFFCHDCLTLLHPMRGPFKRHTIVPVNELWAQKVTDGHGITDKTVGSNPKPACDKHSQPLSIYCVRCKTVICTGCLVEHRGHTNMDVETASERDKATFAIQIGHLSSRIAEIKDACSGFEQLQHDIKTNQDLRISDIVRAYFAALRVLNSWKKTSLEAVRERYSSWILECTACKKDLEMQLEETQSTQLSCQKLLSCPEVEFLQGSKQLTKRINDQITEMAKPVKNHSEIKQKLEKCVIGDPVHRNVLVKEGPTCAKPDLIFTESNNEQLRITDNGSMVMCADLSGREWCRVLTDGRYQTGRHYWEVEISVLTSSSECYGAVGVVKESCGLRLGNLGRDSWYVVMECLNDKVRWYSRCGGDVNAEYRQYKTHTGTQHLGLFLNCENRSMTVLDCDKNQEIFTVRYLKLSEHLVPFVQFILGKSASARLLSGKSATLPDAICNMLTMTPKH